MKIAITGHRPNKLANDYDLTSDLIKNIKYKIKDVVEGYMIDIDANITFISGMALGIDTLFAQIAIEYNRPFIAAIPCKNQWARWPQKSIDRYNEILANPLCTIYNVSDKPYNNTCMQERNKWMVDNSDLLIAVWNKEESGGTYNCIKYAQSIGKNIIFIDPNNFNNNKNGSNSN